MFKKEKIEIPYIPVMMGAVPDGYKLDGIVFAMAGPNGDTGYSFEEIHTELINRLKINAFNEGAEGICNVRISEDNKSGATAYGDKMIKK
ncbi:hypothetical protein [Pediococcus acidilactici]|uniref:hypothetical protein n=1 Tax=Pediococcus acidilactici TaxID=1254 RepID=UPI00325ABF57